MNIGNPIFLSIFSNLVEEASLRRFPSRGVMRTLGPVWLADFVRTGFLTDFVSLDFIKTGPVKYCFAERGVTCFKMVNLPHTHIK